MIREKSLFSDEKTTRSERALHTPGAFARQNLLYIQEVGRLESLTPHLCARENLDSWLFLVVLRGKGSLKVGERHYSIKKGDCAFVNCRERYEHISDEEDAWKLAWVHFNGHSAGGYYQLFRRYNQGSHVFSVEDVDEWNARIGEMLEAQRPNSFHTELRCGELLLSLLNQVIDTVADCSAVETEQEEELADTVREVLNEQYSGPDILQKLENHFGRTVQELNETFSRRYGVSIEEYVSNRRLNAAKELLRFSIKPLETIAQESGIRDIIVMQQMFRESEGMTAEEYRAKWAAWIR
ncbi:MAG: helix-turn-helix domain-containing protein [Lachnospiraceae bacterium]|nr:helix-turn-helix domain-containing protein [Lachnospiraceae bacterium]